VLRAHRTIPGPTRGTGHEPGGQRSLVRWPPTRNVGGVRPGPPRSAPASRRHSGAVVMPARPGRADQPTSAPASTPTQWNPATRPRPSTRSSWPPNAPHDQSRRTTAPDESSPGHRRARVDAARQHRSHRPRGISQYAKRAAATWTDYFILSASAEVEVLAAGPPADWAAIWLMHGQQAEAGP